MKLASKIGRITLFRVISLAVVLILCLIIGYRGIVERAKLPVRPNLESVSSRLAVEIAKKERCLYFPWSNLGSCWFELGQLYHANRFYEEAMVCYLEALAVGTGQDGSIHYYLADIAKENGDLKEARIQLSKTVLIVPDSLPALLELAEVSSKSGDRVAAANYYRRVLERDKANPKALLELARGELAKGDDSSALALLLELARENPEDVEGISLLTQVLDSLGQNEKAAAIRSEMTKRKPMPMDNPWRDSLLQQCYDSQRLSFMFEDYFKAGAIEKAFGFLDRIQELDPNGSEPRLLRGYAYFQLKQYQQAIPHYRSAIQLGGASVNSYYYLALCYLEESRLNEASEAARAGIQLDPESADLLVVSADISLRRGERSEAMALFEKALEIDPANLKANRLVSKHYWELGEKGKAIGQLEMVRSLQPSDLSSRMTLGNYYLEIGEIESAVVAFAEATNIEPDNADARELHSLSLLRLGNAKARSGDFPEALNSYSESYRVQPSREEAYLNKVKVLVHLQEYDSAIDTVKLLLERRPHDPVLYVSLGDLHLSSGSIDLARSNWESAMEYANGDQGLLASIQDRLKGLE